MNTIESSAETSIILPTYNRADTLARAIDSVLAQSYRDWELIIVDDGSTDDTEALVSEYGDPRIRYIRQENAGVSAARNNGLELVTGKFITFLDSDDEWLPHFLALCAGFLNHFPDEHFVTAEFYTEHTSRRDNRAVFVDTYLKAAQAIGSHALDLPPGETDDYLRVYESGRPLPDSLRAAASSALPAEGQLYQGDAFRYTRWGYLAWLPTTVITRHALEVVGSFDSGMRHAGDYAFLALLAKHFRTNFISVPCARKHERGIGASELTQDHLARGLGSYNFRINRLRSFDRIHFNAEGATDPELRRIRQHYEYNTGLIALGDGHCSEALTHFRNSASLNRYFWRAWLLRFGVLLLPRRLAVLSFKAVVRTIELIQRTITPAAHP